MSTIQIKAQHVTSNEAYRQVAARSGIDEIDDAVAVTIASWWQSPSTPGNILAALASGAAVEYDDLVDDIYATRWVHGASSGLAIPRTDRQALDALSTWAIQRTAANTRDYAPVVSPVLRYASVHFQQGEDARDALDIIDRKGAQAGLEYLAQWVFTSDPYAYEVYDNPPHDSWGDVFLDGEFILTYSHRYGTAGLAFRFAESQ